MPVGLNTGAKVVAVSGTAVPLVAATTLAGEVVIVAEATNTGTIHAGGSDVDETSMPGITLAAGDVLKFTAPPGSGLQIDLASIWIDASVGTDGVNFAWTE